MHTNNANNHKVVPDFLYRIAIEGLPVETECLREGGVYLVNVDTWEDCVLFTKELLLYPANKESRGILVVPARDAEVFSQMQESVPEHALGSIHVIENTPTSLKSLPQSLDNSIRPYKRTILLTLSGAMTDRIDQTEFRQLLDQWISWLHDNECAILMVFVSGKSPLNNVDMVSNNDLLSGLAHLERVGEKEFVYRCSYWRCALGVCAGRHLKIFHQNDTLRVQSLDSLPLLSTIARRHNHYVIETAALKDFGYTHEHGWTVVESRNAVYECARQHPNVTAVFALSNHKQLPEIARLLHALRRERGPDIKLVVREMFSQLRMQDEQKLLDCGANLIIGSKISYTRFKSLLDNIQTVRYARELVDSVELLFPVKGNDHDDIERVVEPKEFLQRIRFKLSTYRQQENEIPLGVLVKLELIDGLPAGQAMAQIALRRQEDLATYTANHIFLFLHGCLPELANIVLQQLFRMPLDDLFLRQTVYEDEPGIRIALQQLEDIVLRSSLQQTAPETKTDLAPKEQTDSESEGVNYKPKRTSLRFS